MRTWCLAFQAAPGNPLVFPAVVAAVEAGLGAALAVSWSDWDGNPRDGFGRLATGTAEIPASGAVSATARLGSRRTQHPGLAEDLDVTRIQVTLSGEDVPVMSRLWAQLAGALGTLGYTDRTLAEVPAAIVEALEETGEVERAAALRRQITDVLCEKIAAAPAHWPVVISFTRPHDLERVLRSAPCPPQVTALRIYGCGLARLPAVLLEAPVLFPALEVLTLSRNPLEALPPLKPLYPNLRQLFVQHCPPLVFKRADWAGVKVVRRSPRIRLS